MRLRRGLPDSFWGTIAKARYLQWNYNGHLDHFIVTADLHIEPCVSSRWPKFQLYYPVGSLAKFAISGDGLRVGATPHHTAEESNWEVFLSCLNDTGLTHLTRASDISRLEGISGWFERIEHPHSSANHPRTILVITSLERRDGQ